MTEESSFTACKHGGHPSTMDRHERMAHCVNPAIKGVQPPSRQAAANSPTAEPQLLELPVSHDPVLLCRQFGDNPVTWMIFCTVLMP
jgi:hypothetical protein